jgi:hypothetical protein
MRCAYCTLRAVGVKACQKFDVLISELPIDTALSAGELEHWCGFELLLRHVEERVVRIRTCVP